MFESLKLEFERRVLPGVKARDRGPKQTKGSGKAVGSRKRRARSAPPGPSTRHRGTGNRARPGPEGATGNDGMAPLTRRRRGD